MLQILVLRNHGVLALGDTAEEAFYSIFHLQAACEVQVRDGPWGGGTELGTALLQGPGTMHGAVPCPCHRCNALGPCTEPCTVSATITQSHPVDTLSAVLPAASPRVPPPQVSALASAGGAENLIVLERAKHRPHEVGSVRWAGSTFGPMQKSRLGEHEFEALMRMLDNLVSILPPPPLAKMA